MLLDRIIYADQEAISELLLSDQSEYDKLVANDAEILLMYTYANKSDIGKQICIIADKFANESNVHHLRTMWMSRNTKVEYMSLYVASTITTYLLDVADRFEDLIDSNH